MSKAKHPVILSPAEARVKVRRIDEEGNAEPLVKNSILIEDSLWQELLVKYQAEGTNVSREFRRFAQREVTKRS
jgi:hypothetical protein